MFSSKQQKRVQGISEECGFTLIEVLIAMCVLGIGVMGVSFMQTTAISANNSAMRLSGAVAIASDQMEQMMAKSYGALSDGSATSEGVTVSWSVTSNDANTSGTSKVHTTVTWKDRGQEKTFEWDTIRGSNL